MQYIFLTILLTVYAQLVIKWKIATSGVIPAEFHTKLLFLLKLLFNPFVISGFAAAFIAALCWIMAISRYQLSYVYPFVGLTFALVLLFSNVLFHEPITWQKVVGVTFIIMGVAVSAYKR